MRSHNKHNNKYHKNIYIDNINILLFIFSITDIYFSLINFNFNVIYYIILKKYNDTYPYHPNNPDIAHKLKNISNYKKEISNLSTKIQYL